MCIVVDIDGTLVTWQSDRPDWDSYNHVSDVPVEPVLALLKDQWLRQKIVILSARPEICRQQTEFLLQKHGIKYDALILRKDRAQHATEFKSDCIKYIQQNFGEITYVIEDDPQNVRMFVNKGIFVIDVGCNFRS